MDRQGPSGKQPVLRARRIAVRSHDVANPVSRIGYAQKEVNYSTAKQGWSIFSPIRWLLLRVQEVETFVESTTILLDQKPRHLFLPIASF